MGCNCKSVFLNQMQNNLYKKKKTFTRAALEHEQVASIDWSEWRVIVLLAAFTLTLFTYYTITPIVMKITSAMAINLSLLTADFYTLVIGVLLFQFKVSSIHSVLFESFKSQFEMNLFTV